MVLGLLYNQLTDTGLVKPLQVRLYQRAQSLAPIADIQGNLPQHCAQQALEAVHQLFVDNRIWNDGLSAEIGWAGAADDIPVQGHSLELAIALTIGLELAAHVYRRTFPLIAATGCLNRLAVGAQDIWRVDAVNSIEAKLRAALEVFGPQGGHLLYPAANDPQVSCAIKSRANKQGVSLHQVTRLDEAFSIFGLPTTALWTGNPFRGFDPYQITDERIFFGRETDIQKIEAQLVEQASLLLVGPPGSGKTSLASAGIASKWRRRYGDSSVRWCKLSRDTPADKSLQSLFEALQGISPKFAAPQGTDLKKLLIVDSLDPVDHWSPDTLQALRCGLATWLTQDDAKLLATVRSQSAEKALGLLNTSHHCDQRQEGVDPVARSAAFPSPAPLGRGYERLNKTVCYPVAYPPMGVFSSIIEEPARQAGYVFQTAKGIGLDAQISDEISANHDPMVLPLLNRALWQLHEATDRQTGCYSFATWQHVGGIDGVVCQQAEALCDKASVDLLKQLLWHLAAPDRPQGPPSYAPRVVEWPLLNQSPMVELAKTLLENRLLTFEQPEQNPLRIRVTHRALLNTWPRARAILDQQWSFLCNRQKFEVKADAWKTDDDLVKRPQALQDLRALRKAWPHDLSDNLDRYSVRALRQHTRRLAVQGAVLGLLCMLVIFSLGEAWWIKNLPNRTHDDLCTLARQTWLPWRLQAMVNLRTVDTDRTQTEDTCNFLLDLASNPNVSPEILDRLVNKGYFNIWKAVSKHPAASCGLKRILAKKEFLDDLSLMVACRETGDLERWLKSDDEILLWLAAHDERATPKQLQQLAERGDNRIKEAVGANPSTNPDTLDILAKKNDLPPEIRVAVSGNPAAPLQTLKIIGEHTDLDYKIACNIFLNPCALTDKELISAVIASQLDKSDLSITDEIISEMANTCIISTRYKNPNYFIEKHRQAQAKAQCLN